MALRCGSQPGLTDLLTGRCPSPRCPRRLATCAFGPFPTKAVQSTPKHAKHKRQTKYANVFFLSFRCRFSDHVTPMTRSPSPATIHPQIRSESCPKGPELNSKATKMRTAVSSKLSQAPEAGQSGPKSTAAHQQYLFHPRNAQE